MSTKNTVKIGDREYDLSEVADVAQLQATLVPDNWPGNKADCVRLFLQTRELLAFQFSRHLAHNWLKLCKTAQETKEDGDPAKVKAGFAFELDQSAPLVAAITKCKMSFSATHSTESKPITKDITQGEFLGDDMSVILDTSSLDKEMQESEKPAAGEGGENGAGEPGEPGEGGERAPADANGADAGGENPPDPENPPAAEPGAEPEKSGKKKRSRKKKEATAAAAG
jgi:hypothetical protein